MAELEKRTVVFVTPGFSEPGGCASHGRKIAQGLAERGWSVDVVTRLGSGRSFRRLGSAGLRVIEIPGFGRRRLGGVLFLMLAIPLIVLRRRPHAFVAMQLSSPATVASVGAIVHRCPRLLVFSTSTGPAGEAAFVRNARTSLARRFLLGRASALVAQTEAAASELRDLLPRARVVIVPTPVRLPGHVPPLNGDAAVVYTGRIVRGKNLERLIGLWPSVLKRVPAARLTLVGSGRPGDPVEDELRLQRAASPDLAGTIEMTGWVVDVRPYLEQSDVYVFPSDSEGMSNALLEACALGRVVVASDIPGNRAVLGDAYPLLFDPADVAAFRSALIASLTDQSIRSEAREQIIGRMSRFSDASVVAQIETLLGS
jgi:glycosyltransferase involved in cell wall biosynthesis